MKILITGAGGFIGSCLTAELLKQPNTELFCVVSQNAINKLSGETITYTFLDLSSSDFDKRLPKTADIVIHLAQSNAYRNFPDKAKDIFDINVKSTQILLDWSIKAGIKKFIYASSGNVYLQQNKKLIEQDTCDSGSYYGASKYAAEQLIKPYQQYFNTVIIRIFGVYGPRQKNMTVPNIINKVLQSEEITLAKNAGLYFTPLYIDDCIEMLIKLIEYPTTKNYQVYNFSGNEVVNLGDLVKIVSEKTETKPNIKVVDIEPMYLMGDSTKFFNDYNYIITVPFKTGVEKMMNYETTK